MPPAAIPRTVRDFIFYYYAKLVVAPSAGFVDNYGVIMDVYRRLKRGEMRMSDYDREVARISQDPGLCAFCGTAGPTTTVSIVPSRRGGPVGLQNLVYACLPCAESKDDKDLFSWWCDELGRDKEDMPRAPAGLFLKLAYEKHTVEFTLNRPCHDIREIWDAGV